MADVSKLHVLLTGGTDGIGRAAALELAGRGVQLAIMARNPAKAEQTLALIRARTGRDDITILAGDLADLASVRAAAQAYRQRFTRLDVLLNHGGGYFTQRQLSVDGFELSLATNYLGPAALTLELLDLLDASEPARIVNTTSFGEHLGPVRFDDLNFTRGYSSMRAYAQSKKADLMFTFALARRLAQTRVTVNAFHPGLVRTNIEGNKQLLYVRPLMPFFALNPEVPGHTLTELALNPSYAGVTGHYYTNGRQLRASAEARDLARQERLWRITQEILQAHAITLPASISGNAREGVAGGQ